MKKLNLISTALLMPAFLFTLNSCGTKKEHISALPLVSENYVFYTTGTNSVNVELSSTEDIEKDLTFASNISKDQFTFNGATTKNFTVTRKSDKKLQFDFSGDVGSSETTGDIGLKVSSNALSSDKYEIDNVVITFSRMHPSADCYHLGVGEAQDGTYEGDVTYVHSKNIKFKNAGEHTIDFANLDASRKSNIESGTVTYWNGENNSLCFTYKALKAPKDTTCYFTIPHDELDYNVTKDLKIEFETSGVPLIFNHLSL